MKNIKKMLIAILLLGSSASFADPASYGTTVYLWDFDSGATCPTLLQGISLTYAVIDAVTNQPQGYFEAYPDSTGVAFDIPPTPGAYVDFASLSVTQVSTGQELDNTLFLNNYVNIPFSKDKAASIWLECSAIIVAANATSAVSPGYTASTDPTDGGPHLNHDKLEKNQKSEYNIGATR